MIKIIFYTYIFVRWTGGWGFHTGLGAWLFFLLWTAFMVLSVCMGALGPLLTIISIGRLFKCNVSQIRYGLVRIMHTPGGMALIFGHIGTMAITALICYFAYFLLRDENLVPCIVNLGKPSFFEWLLLAWYLFSVQSFFKNIGTFGDVVAD